MESKLNPYISFQGNAREAMETYKSIFGGSLDLTTYKDGGMTDNQADADQIMHGMLVTDNDMTIMGSDTPDGMDFNPGARISISLSGHNEAELSGYFNALSEGGITAQPLTKAPWGDTFGMTTDKYGVLWMVNIMEHKAD